MTGDRSASDLQGLVRELCKLPRETGWAEFKADNTNPAEIGEYISALANAAALAGKTAGYLLWGVRDDDHHLVGTAFDPAAERKGNEELESWLLRLLSPRIDFRFQVVEVDGVRVVILEIDRAARQPVAFSGVEYIRVGSYKDKEERVRAYYWHACLKYVEHEPVTNSTIRERFGIEEQNRAMASRLLKDAVDAGVIVQRDPDGAPKHRQYLPWWATATRRGSA